MSTLEVEGVTKRFGKHVAVDHASLTVGEGNLVCLLGPSGCGKTTLLRLIAGLDEVSEGTIVFDGRSLEGVAAHERGFGMVFQSLALFPHLSVGENIAYPLSIRGASKSDQKARVEELLEMVQLPGIAKRPVSKLSGGQRQRIAIARALAVAPKLFLLDEPLSALDAKLREAMQVELKRLQQQLGVTTIVVTHDQREAMTLADTIVVMRAGRIHQVGSPMDVYRKPADAFVADFIGETNLLSVRRENGAVVGEGFRLDGLSLPDEASEGFVSVRPEAVRLGAGDVGVRLDGKVTFRRDVGAHSEVFVETAAGVLRATVPFSPDTPDAGADVKAGFSRDDVVTLGPREDASR